MNTSYQQQGKRPCNYLLQGILLVAVGVVLVVTKVAHFFFGALFLLLGLSSLFRPTGPRAKNLGPEIINDAKRFNCEIPAEREIHYLLRKLYQRYRLSIQTIPHLRDKYQKVLENLWQSLSLTDNPVTWQRSLEEVLADWPAQENYFSRVRSSLDEARKATHDWTDAQKETLQWKM
jgi:hypothetical protein